MYYTAGRGDSQQFGGCRAAFVLRLDFWLERCGHWRDGRRWVYNTLEGWCEDLPWLSLGTLRRVIGALRAMGVVRVARYNRVPTDRTLWYTLDYEVLGEILRGVVEGRAQMDVRNLRRSYQVDTTEKTKEGRRGPTSLQEDPGAAGRWVRGEEAHPLAPEAGGEACGEAWGEELGEEEVRGLGEEAARELVWVLGVARDVLGELGVGDVRRGARAVGRLWLGSGLPSGEFYELVLLARGEVRRAQLGGRVRDKGAYFWGVLRRAAEARGAQAAPRRDAGRNCAERAFCEVARPSPTRPQHSSPGTASTRRPARVLHVAWGHLLLEITPLNRH